MSPGNAKCMKYQRDHCGLYGRINNLWNSKGTLLCWKDTFHVSYSCSDLSIPPDLDIDVYHTEVTVHLGFYMRASGFLISVSLSSFNFQTMMSDCGIFQHTLSRIVPGTSHNMGQTLDVVLSHGVSKRHYICKNVSDLGCIMFTSAVHNFLSNNKSNPACTCILISTIWEDTQMLSCLPQSRCWYGLKSFEYHLHPDPGPNYSFPALDNWQRTCSEEGLLKGRGSMRHWIGR